MTNCKVSFITKTQVLHERMENQPGHVYNKVKTRPERKGRERKKEGEDRSRRRMLAIVLSFISFSVINRIICLSLL